MPDVSIITTRRAPGLAPVEPARGLAAEGPPSEADGLAAAMVDALVVAWTMFRVYADPRPQDAFRRAVATLGACPTLPWLVEVHGAGFRHAGRPVPTRRQATAGLARGIFARGIAALGFSGPPTPDDLIALFEFLSSHQAAADPPESPGAALAAAGAARIVVIEHGRLTGAPEGLEGAEVLVAGDQPERADPSQRYLEEYRLLYERLQAGDFQGLQELVHGFTDSFFVLPREQQTALFEQFLTRQEEEPFRLLLDQFSQDDMAELARLLTPGTHPLLVEYARIAAAQEGGETPAEDVLPADRLVSDRIAAMLRSGRDELRRQVGEALRAQAPCPQANLAAGAAAASALFALADDAGFARLARTVAAKTAAACQDGDLTRAVLWSRTALAAARTREGKEIMRREMEAALRAGVLDRMLAAIAALPAPPPDAVTLVALFGLEPIVERMATEDDPEERRALAGLLTAAARIRPGPLLRRLTDPRRRLVRDLMGILADSGRPEAAAGLRTACSHPDAAIRLEALRSLARLDGEQAGIAALSALHDPEAGVRAEARRLLVAATGREPDLALAAFLRSRPAPDEGRAAVEVLARRRTGLARATLQHLARRRFFASPAARDLQKAARRALGGGRS